MAKKKKKSSSKKTRFKKRYIVAMVMSFISTFLFWVYAYSFNEKTLATSTFLVPVALAVPAVLFVGGLLWFLSKEMKELADILSIIIIVISGLVILGFILIFLLVMSLLAMVFGMG